MVYEIMTAIVLILGLISLNKYKLDYKKLFVSFAGIAFAVFMGFRSVRVGTDTLGYVGAFEESETLSFSFLGNVFREKEPLYYALQALVRTVTDNYTVFFTIIAIFLVFSVCRFIYKYSANPTMSFIAYMSMMYFAFNLAGIRQTIALGILLFAMDAMLEKKPIVAILLVGLASLFHISSLVGIAIIAIYYLPLNAIYIAICAALSLFMYLSGNSFWKRVVEIIWEDSRGYEEEFGGTSTLILLLLVAAGIAFIAPKIFTRKSKLEKLDEEEQKFIRTNAYFYKLLLFSIPFQVLAIYQANAFRVAMIFHIVILAVLPNAVRSVKDYRERAILNIGLIVCFLIQLFVFTYGVADINPYTFFWQV